MAQLKRHLESSFAGTNYELAWRTPSIDEDDRTREHENERRCTDRLKRSLKALRLTLGSSMEGHDARRPGSYWWP